MNSSLRKRSVVCRFQLLKCFPDWVNLTGFQAVFLREWRPDETGNPSNVSIGGCEVESRHVSERLFRNFAVKEDFQENNHILLRFYSLSEILKFLFFLHFARTWPVTLLTMYDLFLSLSQLVVVWIKQGLCCSVIPRLRNLISRRYLLHRNRRGGPLQEPLFSFFF